MHYQCIDISLMHSPSLVCCFLIVLNRDLFVNDELGTYHANRTTNLMFCTTSESKGEATDRSNAVVLLRFYVACFGVRVSVMTNLMSVHIILVRFRFLSGHLLGKSCPFG